jgi:hypothetical protein
MFSVRYQPKLPPTHMIDHIVTLRQPILHLTTVRNLGAIVHMYVESEYKGYRGDV